MKILQNFKVRLTLWYLLLLIAAIMIFSLTSYFLLQHSLSQSTIDPWDVNIAQTRNAADGTQQVTGFLGLSTQIGVPQNPTVLIQTYTRSELLQSGSDDIKVDVPNTGNVLSINKKLLASTGSSNDSIIRLYVFSSQDNPREYGLLVINQSMSGTGLVLANFRKIIFFTAGVTLVLAGILGFFLVKRMLKPIRNITQTAQDIEENNLSRRLDVWSNDELGKLAATLNQMFERLEQSFSREHQFTADVSHELRTPLAIAQGEATLSLQQERSAEEYRRTIETISRETANLSNIINRLLFLAQSDSGQTLPLEDIGLKSLLMELSSDAEILFEEKNIHFKLDAPNDVIIKGDKIRLRECILNLLDNAVHYTPCNGSIATTLDTKDNYATIAVKDTGIGIPENQFTNIFQRFHRVDKSRSRSGGGVGLGLAICQRIVELHQGKITVESKEGVGSVFTVYLPLNR
ncbi:MAG: HAMP domain-containing sensor histidine kinase [Dehalococcoidales bacterium]|jgi:heavy metal sensor kinase